MTARWVAPPAWPVPPEGFTPPPGWHPDPSWPQAPRGWQFWQEPPLPTAVLVTSGLIVVGAVLSVVASCLSWYNVLASDGGGQYFTLQTIRGVSYEPFAHVGPGVAGMGLLIVVLAVVAFLAAALPVGARAGARVAAAVAVVAGGIATALLVWTVVTLHAKRHDLFRYQATHHVWLALAGAGLVVLSGLCQMVLARPSS